MRRSWHTCAFFSSDLPPVHLCSVRVAHDHGNPRARRYISRGGPARADLSDAEGVTTRRRTDASMSAAVFEVPVVFQDLPRHETYAQLCTSVASLVDASDRIFSSLNDRLDLERGACDCLSPRPPLTRCHPIPDADVHQRPYPGRLRGSTARAPTRSDSRGERSECLLRAPNPNTRSTNTPRECGLSTWREAPPQPTATPTLTRVLAPVLVSLLYHPPVST